MEMSSTFSMRLDPQTAEYLSQLANRSMRSRASTVRWLIVCAAKGYPVHLLVNQSHNTRVDETIEQLTQR